MTPTLAMDATEALPGFWYPILRSREVRGARMRRAMLFGVPLVVGRTADGHPFALRDNCPHRGMPLSFGRFDGHELECCYHGWRWDAVTGQCRGIPSLTGESALHVDRIYAAGFPCREQDGYVWAFAADREQADALPPVPRLPVESPQYRLTHFTADMPVGVDQVVVMLLDFAHGAFVHQVWFWRRQLREKAKVFEPLPLGFRMRPYTHTVHRGPYRLAYLLGGAASTTIEFHLPSTRVESMRVGRYWVVNRVTVTPLASGRSRMDFCAAWNVFRRLPFGVSLFRLFGRPFLRQDERSMQQLSEGLRSRPPTMLIDDADRPARWYFALKKAYLESRDTGRPLEHPLPEPVTLRWRT